MEGTYKDLVAAFAALKEDQAHKRGEMEVFNQQKARAQQDFLNSVCSLKSVAEGLTDESVFSQVNQIIDKANTLSFEQGEIKQFARELDEVITSLEQHIKELMA